MKSQKKSSFFSMAPVSSTLICATAATRDVPPPPAKGAFSSDDGKHKPEDNQSPKPAAVSTIVDEFFWIGSSIVAFSRWRLGYTGRFEARQHEP